MDFRFDGHCVNILMHNILLVESPRGRGVGSGQGSGRPESRVDTQGRAQVRLFVQ